MMNKLRQMIDLIPALLWSCRPDGSVNFFNRGWLEYTGVSAPEALERGWTSALHPEDVSRVISYWNLLLANPGPGDIDVRLRGCDGQYHWFLLRARPLLDESGSVVAWYGTSTDIEDRKRAEDALQAIESSRHLTVNSMACTMTRSGDMEVVNQQVLDCFYRTREEVRDYNYTVHKADREYVASALNESSETEQLYDVDSRTEGRTADYRWSIMPLDPADNRGQTEDVLRCKLRQMVDSVPGIVTTADASGQHDYANRRAREYTGTSVEDFRDDGFINTIHPDEQEFVRTEWLRCRTLGIPMDIRHRWRRFDGVYRWFHVRVEPLIDDHGRIVRWYGLLTDIDDQIRAEDALRKREQEVQRLVATVPAFIWRATAQGRLDVVSQRVLDYTGATLADLRTSGWEPFIHPDDVASVLRTWRDCCAAGTSYELSFRLRRSTGEFRWFQVYVEPLRASDGRIAQWYGLMLDIDDRKQLEEAFQSTRRRLSVAMQMATVAELSASIAHEINQPLAAVVANGHACLTWLSSDPPNLERARLTAERAIRDGNSAAEVVGRIRALFKQAAPAMAATNINEIITEALNLIADEIRDSGASVQRNLAADLPPVMVDRIQLQQTIVNLTHNAVEAMTEVTDWPRMLTLTTRREGDSVLIQVRDTGTGIDNDHAIFEPFFTTKVNGMGMGLAICRSIVEVHGGRLWAEPNKGPGATFRFSLPAHPNMAS